MLPESIDHCGVAYAISHLRQTVHAFKWLDVKKEEMSFSVRVRYSEHCFTEELVGNKYPPGSYMFAEKNTLRMFCPVRYARSHHLPDLIGSLFVQPGKGVGITNEDNCSIYRLDLKPALAPGIRYAVFFRVRWSDPLDRSTNPYRLDVYVESAYERDRRIEVRKTLPFGKVMEMMAKGQRL